MGISNRGGAGLGLYISRNLIEMAGGEVSLSGSLIFVGSEFTVDLPAFASAGEKS